MGGLSWHKWAFIRSTFAANRRNEKSSWHDASKRTCRKLKRLSKPMRGSNCTAPVCLRRNASQRSAGGLPPSSVNALRLGVVGWVSALAVPTVLACLDANAAHGAVTDYLGVYASHYYMVVYNALFALLHSGLASLRPLLTRYTGERLYRVGFALSSLPSAVGLIAYFIAHRYDGKALWTLQGVPHVHELCYLVTFISFLLLYPATFNLLEVAAVQKPSFRIYETGVMRISRHPQLGGQMLWCLAHGAWMGTSFTLVACLTLIAQHLVGAWNGDRRLRDKYGEEWVRYAERTSIVPFASIMDGKQRLRWGEFGFGYVGVVLFVLGTYAAHPWMLRVVGNLRL